MLFIALPALCFEHFIEEIPAVHLPVVVIRGHEGGDVSLQELIQPLGGVFVLLKPLGKIMVRTDHHVVQRFLLVIAAPVHQGT